LTISKAQTRREQKDDRAVEKRGLDMILLLVLSLIALFWFVAAATMSERESKVDHR
jgi:hypothetical protein